MSDRTNPKPARLLAITVIALTTTPLLLLAGEHAKTWRNAKPWDKEFLRRMADPAEEAKELAVRMAPPAPAVGEHDEATVLAHSAGCVSCHGPTDEPDMHPTIKLAIGCTDCHGGDASVMSTMSAPGRPGKPGTPIEDDAYLAAMNRAHVLPRNPQAWYGAPVVAYGDHAHADPMRLHGSRTPEASATLLLKESPEFVRFINPGDLRVADFACGACHAQEVANNRHSMMTHGAQLWGAALYNNGSVPNKTPRFGESYSAFGIPQRLQGAIAKAEWDKEMDRLIVRVRRPSDAELAHTPGNGVLMALDPLPVWNISQPGNMLRIFERGTKLPVPGGPTPNPAPNDIGNPNPLAEGGRPDKGLSPRGLGTLNRTDPVFLGLQKTRLLDPMLSMPGTNDHPGDFRHSGCTACHTPYANDRDPAHSTAELAAVGNSGFSRTIDPTIPHDEPGHPVRHVLTSAIPSSQCVVCHMHPGTSFANQYYGTTWWDNESDGEFMYPAKEAKPTDRQRWVSLRKNPDDTAARGLWGDLYPDAISHAGEPAGDDFLARSGKPSDGESTLNDRLNHNQFADFHGHGWIFRQVHKRDRRGNLLDSAGTVIDHADPMKWNKAIHLGDVHMQGANPMHCVDCHFKQDVHGDGNLYGEVRNAVEITCVDCHGSYSARANLHTSGPAAPDNPRSPTKRGTNIARSRVFGKPRFFEEDGKVMQRSATDPKVVWQVVQTIDTIDPDSAWAKGNPEAATASRYAKTVRRRTNASDEIIWGDVAAPQDPAVNPGDPAHAHLAHGESVMQCYTCHTSWMTSCFGCHLTMEANERTPTLHNEGQYTRNFTRYNFQVLRDDIFMLGRDSTVKGNLIVPVRSSSAVLVGSQNANREWIYSQQQTVSAEGYSGQAFNPHYPHAVSGRGTTKQCTDCHISKDNDNNAWMAQLLLQGTNMVNFVGRYAYVAQGEAGLEAVVVTERDEPQAVMGSRLHELAYPERFARFVERDSRQLKEAYHHDGRGIFGNFSGASILDVQLRGEYLYAARGPAGFYVFDVANIDHKGFSERIVTAPVSPLGQRLGFDTKNCVAIASPSTLAVDSSRARLSSDPSQPHATIMDPLQPHHVNQEQAVHPMYAYLYIGDAEEGLILTSAATLLDGDPTNNFLERAALEGGGTAFNPDGVLTGLTSLTLAGHYAYATAPAGLVVIDLNTPTSPRVAAVVSDELKNPRHAAVQFRYAFVTDEEGLKVIDVTEPTVPRAVAGATVALADAKKLYLCRTHALVAAGAQGLAIIDITSPERPTLQQLFTADGQLNDCRDVKAGMTNASLYAYVADGCNGLRVLSLMGPDSTPNFRGFAPPLAPRLIATRHTHGPALAVSKGLDRDRAVDETGNQVAVFGRIGSRPMTLDEQRRLYMKGGEVWRVSNTPETPPVPFTAGKKGKEQEKADAPAKPPTRRRRN